MAEEQSKSTQVLDAELLKILACPLCVTSPERPPEGSEKGALEYLPSLEQPKFLRCRQCRRKFRIEEDGIPNLILEEAILDEVEGAKGTA